MPALPGRGYRTRRAGGGFSLVELLVALTLGLLLMSGTLAVFVGNKRSSELNEALSDMQESARFALDRIARDIRMSAYQGCAGIDSIALGTAAAPIIADSPPTANLAFTATAGAVIGGDGSWSPTVTTGFDTAAANAAPGTHALLLQFGGPTIGRLASGQASGGVPDASAPLVVAGDFPLRANELAIVSDCERVELFRASAVTDGTSTTTIAHAATVNSSAAFAFPFGQPAAKLLETQVMPFQSNVYYVADTGLRNERGQRIRALYQQSLPYDDPDGNPPVELARGVDDLRLSFGIDIGGGGVSYVLPGAAGYAPQRVVAVRVGLLMSSLEPLAEQDDDNVYTLAGASVAPRADGVAEGSPAALGTHPGDARLRFAFNTTVKVRNRR